MRKCSSLHTGTRGARRICALSRCVSIRIDADEGRLRIETDTRISEVTGHDSSRSRRWTVGLLLALALVLAVGVWLLIVMLSGPQTIELEISAPVGKEIYYDIVLDGVASSGVAEVPATLKFEGRRIAFAVIPKCDTVADLDLSLHTRHAGGTHHGPGVTGTFVHTAVQSQMTLRPMSAVHVANMRRAREGGESSPKSTAPPSNDAEGVGLGGDRP